MSTPAAALALLTAATVFAISAAYAYYHELQAERAARASMARALAKERAAHADHLEQAARHVDQLSAIIARQASQAIHAAGDNMDAGAAIANLTAENERLRQKAQIAMLEAIDANLANYAIRHPGLLRPQQPGRN